MENQISFFSLIVILGSFLGLTIGFFLLFVKSAKNKANIFLGISILAFTLYFLPTALDRIGLLEYVPHIVRLNLLSGFLLGPSMYFYVKSCTQKGFRLRKIDYLHFTPVLLELLYHLPFYFSSGPEKIEAMHITIQTGDLHIPIWIPIAKWIHNFIYYLLSLKIILEYRNFLDNETSFIDKAFHRWLIAFASALLIPIIAFIFFIITGNRPFALEVTFFTILIYFFCVYIATLTKPAFFHRFPHKMPVLKVEEVQKQKYENSSLQEVQKEKYVQKLIAHMDNNKPYEAPELTLSQLSEQVHISTHYLSQVINEKLKCSFIDFINSYRVEAAKTKLCSPDFEHYTIIAIAYEAGFNSKSAFYSAFKKYVGTTPSAFRKSAKVTA